LKSTNPIVTTLHTRKKTSQDWLRLEAALVMTAEDTPVSKPEMHLDVDFPGKRVGVLTAASAPRLCHHCHSGVLTDRSRVGSGWVRAPPADAPYARGNCGLSRKVKCLHREEFVVVGWTA
jgi:hypothetical protein